MSDSEGRGNQGGVRPAARERTAALVVIGNEILAGRTRDGHTAHLGAALAEMGIRLTEVRIVGDDREAIARAVNDLRKAYDCVLTTGGIGPTHDDITAESIAHAFGVPLVTHPEAFARLQRHYGDREFNAARQGMARVPEGATLIDNPVSAAPGFQIANVFVMAGIPNIMHAMFNGISHRLGGGPPLRSRTVAVGLGEGVLAEGLHRLQRRYPSLEIGSYPRITAEGPRVRIVLSGIDGDALAAAVADLLALVDTLGGEAEEMRITS